MKRLKSGVYEKELDFICNEPLPFERLRDKSILITGGTGLIGSYLVDTFMHLNEHKQLNLSASILCRNVISAKEQFGCYTNLEQFSVLQGDLTKNISLTRNFDYVIHGAGNNHPVAFRAEPVETMKTALLGTMNLLDALKEQNKDDSTRNPQFLFLSSGEVYGEVEEIQEAGCKEEEVGIVDPMNPRSCYPEAKRAAETLCVSYGLEYGLDTRIARLSYIYGGTFKEESSKADIQFLKKALAGQDIVMKSPGLQFRSYCYLQDAVKGILYIMLRGKNGEAYNVANGKTNVTIREFAETLAKKANVNVVFEHPEDMESQGYSKLGKEVLNPEKLESLGYRASVGLEEAFERILEMKVER